VKAGDLNALTENKYVGNFCLKVNDEAIKKYNLKEYSANCIVFPKSGMSVKTDNIALLKSDSYVVNHLAVIQVTKNELCIPEYLFYLFRQIKISNLSLNDSYPSIRINDIRKLKIPLPSLPTQNKIVAILEKAEKLKGWRRDADELTDEFLKSTFLEMFGDPVKNHNGWKAVKLQDVSEIVSGVTKGRKLSGKEVISVPYLRVANVQDGYLKLNEIKLIEVLPLDVEKFALKEGDVLLTEGGDPDKLGRGSVWHDEIPNCIHQNHIFRVRVNKKHLIPEYLSMLIGSPYGKMYFLKSAKQTTGIASINSKQLKNFPALIPPLELQNKLAKIIRQTEQLREQQKQSSQHIDDLFNAFMQQAFRGELTT
jgi:type I restriction enzyme, S subunit